MWASVRQTFQSQSVSAWRAGVQFGCTPPGIPSRTGLRTSSLSAVASPFLGPHSKHGRRLEPALSGAQRRVHGVPEQGVSIHIVKSGVPGWNLRCGDPIRQLLPGSEPPDSPVVMTQLGGHFQTVVCKYHSMACCSGMTMEEVHVVTVHCHYKIPKGSLISQAGDSGLLPSNILHVIPGHKIKVVPASVLCTYECLKATMKIKTI